MARVTTAELFAAVERLTTQVAEMSKRLDHLEGRDKPAAVAAAVPVEPAAAGIAAAGITEEELLAISAAIGAYLGVRAHIRQIRLVGSNAWAQQGRVSIQASHTLQG